MKFNPIIQMTSSDRRWIVTSGGDKMMSRRLRSRYVKDYSLPIPVLDDPYFSYYIGLFDRTFQTRQSHGYLETMVSRLGESLFFEHYNAVKNKVIDAIKSSAAFNRFQEMNLERYDFSGSKWNKRSLVYQAQNHRTTFITIDLMKANFHVMQYVDPELVLGAKTYPEMLRPFTDEPYILGSKYIRQVIFGHLNSKRQQHVQKYIMGQIDQVLVKDYHINPESIDCSTADEITFRVEEGHLTSILQTIASAFQNELHVFYHMARVEPFVLHQLGSTSFFVKEFVGSDKVDFKGIPKVFFPQCFRYYYHEPCHEYDLVFEHEKRLARFLQPLTFAEMPLVPAEGDEGEAD